MSVFNVGFFKGPRYSAFPWEHNNKISMKGGKIVPIAWDFLNTGDKIDKVDVSNVVRVAPMVAPTLDTYRVDVHAFAVRLRSIGHVARNPWVYEDFFNLNKNVDGSASLPSLPLGLLFAVNGFRNGTLYESMGFPTFKALREQYLEHIRKNAPWVFDSVAKAVYFTTVYVQNSSSIYVVPASVPLEKSGSNVYNYDLLNSFWSKFSLSYSGGTPSDYFRNVDSDSNQPVSYRGSLIDFVFEKYPGVFALKYDNLTFVKDDLGVTPSNAQGILGTIQDSFWESWNVLDKVFELYKVDSISVLREFEDWLLDGVLSLSLSGSVSSQSNALYTVTGFRTDSVYSFLYTNIYSSFPNLPVISFNGLNDRSIPAYPFEAYWKIISDWYINTAISDPDNYFVTHVVDSLSVLWSQAPSVVRQRLALMNTFANRYWNNDYFTSAFPSAQIGSAVGIPVNGTIVDLRNANAMQKLKERLLYAGQRFRDVLYGVYGKKTSASILEMSEVLASWSNTINVDSVLQNSESSVNSPQAEYAGTGLGYRSGGKPFSYTAEEPTVIMIVASIVPQASYFQGLPRKFMRSNIYDYAIPQLANVGEQQIYRGELYLDYDYVPNNPNQAIFGWTRRNGDFMWTPNEVHGDFRASLDFWHNSRVFGSVPSLSTTFLEVNEDRDNLNRIFAVSSSSIDHFYCRFDFGGQIIRSLPKHVHYEL